MSKIISIIFFVSIPFLGFGQEPLSLNQAIAKALSNDFGVQIAKIDQEIAENNNTWKAAGKHPTVTANLNNQNAFIIQDNPTSFLGKASILANSINGNIDAAFVLSDGGRIELNKKILEQQLDLSDVAVRQQIEATIESVLESYYQAQIVKEQLKTFDEVLKLSNDRIDYQRVRQEFGQAGSFDLLQVQDALLNDSTSYLTTENNYRSSLRNLDLSMGELNTNIVYDVSDPLEYEPKLFVESEMISKAIKNNTQSELLKISKEIAESQVNLQRTGMKPNLTLNAGLNGSLTGNDLFGDSDFARQINYTIGNSISPYVNLTARFLIYDGENTKRNVKNAQLDVEAANLEIRDYQMLLQTQVLNAINNYQHQLEVIRIAESRLANAKGNLEIAETRFNSAQISSFDYRSVQLSFINADLARLSAIYNLKIAEMQIDKLTGDLIKYQ